MQGKQQKIVIVGGGIGGLTAAAYLLHNGFRNIVIYEKNDRCGGLIDTFEYNGFFFDSGPRAFVNSGMIKPMLRNLGIDIESINNKISIVIEDNVVTVDSMKSLEDYRNLLCKLFPNHIKDIDRIIKATKDLSKITQTLYEIDNPLFINILKNKKFFFKKILPWSFKFLFSLFKMKKNSVSMEKYLERLTDNKALIDIYSQLFFKNTPSYFALGYFYVYLDYFYPKGGTGQLPNSIEQLIIKNGASIQLNKEIKEVNIIDKTIVDTQGNHIYYDQLIWASDLKTFYNNINTRGLKKSYINRINKQSLKILETGASESVYVMFLGVDLPAEYFYERGGAHLFYTPTKAGLGEIHKNRLYDLLNESSPNIEEDIFSWLNDFCEMNTFEISIPNLRDKNLSPDNQSSVMVSCLFDYNLTQYIEKLELYDKFKEFMENKILNILDRNLYKGIYGKILFKFSSTPLTIKKNCGSFNGSIVGWAFDGDSPVPDSILGIPKSPITPIKNVYQAGQWAYSPAGVPLAMFTGWYAAKKIIK
ncbi:MAG: NAD(P)/FAD-dependent oxidoreductase [Spirochaetales bacterium]|nr:NAD(P)/FAD-dependent oxidoreductase [Spirochaetales bacterium]